VRVIDKYQVNYLRTAGMRFDLHCWERQVSVIVPAPDFDLSVAIEDVDGDDTRGFRAELTGARMMSLTNNLWAGEAMRRSARRLPRR
jgi:hypothetical protein